MKLELKHLAPYLPYELKGVVKNYEYKETYIDNLDTISFYDKVLTFTGVSSDVYLDNTESGEFKPILRPLSDLTKEELSILFGYHSEDCIVDFEIITTPFDEFGYIEYELFGVGHISTCIAGYNDLQKLFKKHYDIFNLIPQNLAIDINTL